MKKLIGLLAVLFITTGVFGQKFIRDHSFIETTPTGNNTIEDAIQSKDITNVNYNDIGYVHFVRNDKLYILAYEPDSEYYMGVDRDIYLYSKDLRNMDSPWEKASDIVLTSNWIDGRNYGEVDFWRSEKSRGSFGKVDIDSNKVYITVGFEIMTNGRLTINEPITFGFVWNNNDESFHRFLSYK